MIKHAINKSEILSVIDSTLAVENHFTIWQRGENEELVFQLKGTLLSVSDSGLLIFKLSEKDYNLNQSEIFFAADKASVVYKSRQYAKEGDFLHCELPDEIKYMERRRHRRTKMKKNEFKQVEILCHLKPEYSNKGVNKKLMSRFIDISESGACFYLTKESLDMMDLESKIYLTSLSQDIKLELEIAMIVNVRKVKPMTMSLEEMYAVGVMFVSHA